MTAGDLDGRVALVTGASRGIGRALGIALAGAGAQVALSARSTADLDAVAGHIESAGGVAVAVPCDVSDPGSIESMVATVVDRFGRLDVLVSNAGVLVGGPTVDASVEDIQHTLDVNLRGALLCARAAARPMLAAGGGSIIATSSAFAFVGVADHAAYAASKGGIAAMTRALAVEWAAAGIRVNAIAPGYIRTELNAEALQEEGLRRRVERAIPLGRIGEPEDLAPLVCLLASGAGAYITGQVIVVDGGFTAR